MKYLNRLDVVAIGVDPRQLQTGPDPTTHLDNPASYFLPQLPRPMLRIEESLDQRGLGGPLRKIVAGITTKGLFQRVCNRRPHGKSLNPLSAPIRTNLIAWYAPHFFGVGLKERLVQFPSETIDEELLQSFLRPERKQAASNITQTSLEGPPKSKLPHGVRSQSQRIIKKAA